MNARHVLETCVYAVDLEAAERFYRDATGLTLHSKGDRGVTFRCGEPDWQLLRQCSDGEFLGQVENGVCIPRAVRHQGASAVIDLRVHRSILQSRQETQFVRLRQPRAFEAALN